MRLFDCFEVVIPSGSFHVETVNEHSVFWTVLEVILGLVGNYNEVELNEIDGDTVLSCVVLSSSSQERLGEEET